jgi:hypothetical protein
VKSDLTATELDAENTNLKSVLKQEYDDTFEEHKVLVVEDVDQSGWYE